MRSATHARPAFGVSAAAEVPSLAELISALSFALDLTEGAVPGHALRSCLLGMRVGLELRLSTGMLADLYHALLLKDIGCSSNAARMCQIIGGGDDRAVKAGVKLEDWTRPHQPKLSTLRLLWQCVSPGAGPAAKVAQIFRIGVTQHRNNEEMIALRCDRGASIVRNIGMGDEAAIAVQSLDEHWDGSGYPQRLRGHAISPLARIMAIAQHLDVFALEKGPIEAMRVLRERSGRWFDPDMVRAAESIHTRGTLWLQCLPTEGGALAAPEQHTRAAVLDAAPALGRQRQPAHIDLICEAFSGVVDAKSPFTFRHSLGVTDAARNIGTAMQLPKERLDLLRRAALLHDLGKLRVPNSILDKPGKLDATELAVMQEHSQLTEKILSRVQPFRELAKIAGAHHEKLDGSGYPNHLRAEDMPIETRILVVADMYEALTGDRPYRPGFSIEKTLSIMKSDSPSKLDAECFEALCSTVHHGESATAQKAADLPAAVFAASTGPTAMGASV